MLGLGENFPTFCLRANISADDARAFRFITDHDYPGQWKVFFFWPKDFADSSRDEIIDFARLASEFYEHHAQLLGASVESEYAHLAWRTQDAYIKSAPIPMLADIRRNLAGQLGILDAIEGVAQRAVFIVDPADVIRFVSVTENSIRPDPEETLRVLVELQEAANN